MAHFSRSNVLVQFWNNERSAEEIIPIRMILVDERQKSFVDTFIQIRVLTNTLFALVNVYMRNSLGRDPHPYHYLCFEFRNFISVGAVDGSVE